MEPYTNYSNEHDVLAQSVKFVKTGDILLRASDAKGPLGIPFMKLVANATKAFYTHAAMAMWDDGVLYVIEETDIGLMQYRFIDWIGFCIDERFAVLRLKQSSTTFNLDYVSNMIGLALKKVLDLDPVYNYTFNTPGKFYCTQLVCWLYKQAIGVTLCEPKPVKYFIANKLLYGVFKVGNWLSKVFTKGAVFVDDSQGLYYVGNETNGGIYASPNLDRVFEYTP